MSGFTNALVVRGKRRTVHASPVPAEPWTLTSYVALCGTIVRDVTEVPWRPTGVPDLCPACVGMTADLDRYGQ